MREKLIELRRAAGLTQAEVAAGLGVAQPSVSLWETGRANPTLDNIMKIATVYGVEARVVFAGLSRNGECR